MMGLMLTPNMIGLFIAFIATASVGVFVWLLISLFRSGPNELYAWADAPTRIARADKLQFVTALSYVGGSVGRYHPRWKEMQDDFLEWKHEGGA